MNDRKILFITDLIDQRLRKEKEIEYCKAIMMKWGTKVIKYQIPPRKMTDLLNAKKVNVPIKGV